jgi:hypothetical protein
MNIQPARSLKALFCAGVALFTVGCVVYPDGTAVLLPPPLPVVVGAPVYGYGGYSGYYRPYYGYRNYGYRPYWGGYGGYYRGGYWGGGNYYRGGYGYGYRGGYYHR